MLQSVADGVISDTAGEKAGVYCPIMASDERGRGTVSQRAPPRQLITAVYDNDRDLYMTVYIMIRKHRKYISLYFAMYGFVNVSLYCK